MLLLQNFLIMKKTLLLAHSIFHPVNQIIFIQAATTVVVLKLQFLMKFAGEGVVENHNPVEQMYIFFSLSETRITR